MPAIPRFCRCAQEMFCEEVRGSVSLHAHNVNLVGAMQETRHNHDIISERNVCLGKCRAMKQDYTIDAKKFQNASCRAGVVSLRHI